MICIIQFSEYEYLCGERFFIFLRGIILFRLEVYILFQWICVFGNNLEGADKIIHDNCNCCKKGELTFSLQRCQNVFEGVDELR